MGVEQLADKYGLLGLVIIAAVWVIFQITQALSKRSNVDSKKDETMTGFAVDFNSERKELQLKLETVIVAQAKEEGRREQLETTLTQERKETRERERERDKELFELKSSLDALKKGREDDQRRITELEIQNVNSQSEIQALRIENKLLQGQKHELELLVERETNRANTLSGLVDQINKINQAEQATNKQNIPAVFNEDADDTFVHINEAAPVAAEETTV